MATQGDLTAIEWSQAHHCYYSSNKLALEKFREDGNARAFDDRHPEHTVIHFHTWEPGQGFCLTQGKHEQYRAGQGRIGDSGR